MAVATIAPLLSLRLKCFWTKEIFGTMNWGNAEKCVEYFQESGDGTPVCCDCQIYWYFSAFPGFPLGLPFSGHHPSRWRGFLKKGSDLALGAVPGDGPHHTERPAGGRGWGGPTPRGTQRRCLCSAMSVTAPQKQRTRLIFDWYFWDSARVFWIAWGCFFFNSQIKFSKQLISVEHNILA